MGMQDFKDAFQQDLGEMEQMLNDLMSTDTLISLGESLALAAASTIPVVGQVVAGAASAQRILGVINTVGGAMGELKAIVAEWGKPMTPEQLKAARVKLAKWLMRVGIAAILAAIGKIKGRYSKSAKGRHNSTTGNHQVGTAGKGNATGCACQTQSPVIIATGEKSLQQSDFALPGALPLTWQRHYRSGRLESGWFGQGWSHALDGQLYLGTGQHHYFDPQGRQVPLPVLAIGAEHFDLYEQFTFSRPSEHVWRIEHKHGLMLTFMRLREDLWRLPLVMQDDRNGNRITLHFTQPGEDAFRPMRPYAITDSAGRVLRLGWSERDHLESVFLDVPGQAQPMRMTSYRYNAAGELIEANNALGQVRSFTWAERRLTSYTLADGAKFAASYDAEGRVIHSWNVQTGEGLRFGYDPRQRRNTVTDALGRSTQYEYDQRQDIIATIRPDGSRVATPFDASGKPAAQTDPLGRATRYQFDQRGNLTMMTDPSGAVTRIEYGALDLPVKLTDALGHASQNRFDELGNLIGNIDALGQTNQYRYDERGRLIEAVDAKDGRKQFTWDGHGNLASHTDCSGSETRYGYDYLGRLSGVVDALGQTTRYQWDALGNLIGAQDPDGAIHRYTLDAESRLIAYTDPLGRITRYVWDSMGRLYSRADALGHTLRYEYDAAGQMVTLINENHSATRFIYDVNDNLTDEIGFDGRHQRYLYNAAGELTHLIEAGGSEYGPGKVTHFERDKLGRLLATQHEGAHGGDGSDAQFRYDKLGRLLAADNAHAKVGFAYDAIGQVQSETTLLAGGTPQVLKHGYDPLGNRIRTELPDKRVIHSLYYGSGHLHQINIEENGQHRIVSDIARDKLHREIERSQGKASSRYEYDPMGRLVRHRTQTGGGPEPIQVLGERGYRYDLVGNLLEKVGIAQYEYDPVGRILAARYPNRPHEQFAYDPAGNINDPYLNFPYSDNRVKGFGDVQYAFDVHGNLSRRSKPGEVQNYQWSAAHRLHSANINRNGVVQTVRYEYDALGRRTRKVDEFGQTEFLWDGDLLLHNKRNAKQSLFFYEPDSFVPLATLQNDGLYWYQCDQIGAPMELIDEQAQVAWSVQYQVWGETSELHVGNGAAITATTVALRVAQPFRYQGQQFDEETGLHYNRFRYYDPTCGRFVSQDPIGLLGGFNLFLYSPNPVGWIDPFGLAGEGALGTYGSLTGRKHSGDLMEAHELVRHEALAQMGCTKKGKDGDDLRMRKNPSIAISTDRHDAAHAQEVSLSQRFRTGNGKNQFQFDQNNRPTKQQMDIWQGALRQSGISASQAKKLRKASAKFLKSLCCC